jgi:2-polyprenyl-3-methyl-5-hydroxy-6-metoxy-1,4-benzoquinol methylase
MLREKVGQDDRSLGVVSWDENRDGPPDVAKLLASGDAAVAKWLREGEVVLEALPADVCDVLDFGCGVGQLSRSLAKPFGRVVELMSPSR